MSQRFVYKWISDRNPSPALAGTLSHRMGEGRGEGRAT
jgi:hypothetical protein